MSILTDLIQQLRAKAPQAMPDHKPFIRADFSMCCARHEARTFRVNPDSTARVQEHLSGQQRAYIEARLDSPSAPGPRW
jgi:hypothetical protein